MLAKGGAERVVQVATVAECHGLTSLAHSTSRVCLYELPVPHIALTPLRIIEVLSVNQSVKQRFARRSRSASLGDLTSSDLPKTGLKGNSSELLLPWDCCWKLTCEISWICFQSIFL